MKRLHLTALILSLVCAGVAEAADPPKIAYTGDDSNLQAAIDATPCLLLSPRFLRENGGVLTRFGKRMTSLESWQAATSRIF